MSPSMNLLMQLSRISSQNYTDLRGSRKGVAAALGPQPRWRSPEFAAGCRGRGRADGSARGLEAYRYPRLAIPRFGTKRGHASSRRPRRRFGQMSAFDPDVRAPF
jgi:hypothetical protein